jgi:Sigma-54 interaction domain
MEACEFEGNAPVTGAVEVALSRGHKFSVASTPEWRGVCARHHNMLLEGPEDSTKEALLLLKPHLRKPVVWARSQTPFELPAGECGGLVLQDVAALGRQEQAGLLAWLEDPTDRKQVVATTAHPLFPLVERGLFDETLYYRLAVIRLCVDSSLTVAGRRDSGVSTSPRPGRSSTPPRFDAARESPR